jgi:hypothetical protein
MYDWERIALWIVVLLMALKIFMGPQMSFYTASSPISMMDLAEFKGLPDDLKQIYQDNVLNKVLTAYMAKGTSAWTNASATVKQRIKTDMATWANRTVTQINASTPVIS